MTGPAETTITILSLDRFDVGQALIAVASKHDRAAQTLKPGTKRDNVKARAIRLKRMGEELQQPVDGQS